MKRDSKSVASLSEASGEEQSLPDAGEIGTRPAKTSERPADFANASPFPNRKEVKDTLATAVLAVAVLALIAFLISMIGLWQIRGPL